MSSKRFNPMEYPPTASSSDEDEDSIREGEETKGSYSSEDEDVSVAALVKRKEKQVSDSESGTDEGEDVSVAALFKRKEKQVSDSESGTDSDSVPVRKKQVARKQGSSAVNPVVEIKDFVVRKQEYEKSTTSEKSVAKRSSVEIDGATPSTDVKRAKRDSGEDEKRSGGGEEMKKGGFPRIWTEDDEIAVLQGLINYKNDSGVSNDTNVFYQLVKKSISFDVSKIQFREKLRKLRKKYDNIIAKAEDGKVPTLSKPHDRKVFQLSKLAWGANGVALESAVKSNGKSNKSHKSKKEPVKQELDSSLANGRNCEDEVTNKGEVRSLSTAELDTHFVKSLACFGLNDLTAQQGWSRLASEDKKSFEEQWKAVQVRECEFYLQKSGLIHQVVTKIAEAFRSNP